MNKVNNSNACGVTRESARDFHVVALGASAGGLEALEEFFRAVSVDSGLAFVVIQHLSPDFKSHMEELLSRVTNIPVKTVRDGLPVEPNTIYVIPSAMEMMIHQGRLLLSERSRDRSLIHPIDTFFRSLATDFGRLSIGVVLSGTGSDGSRGIRDIHAAGGLVVAQVAGTAKFDGMPVSALETGAVDVVLPPTAMAEALERYTREGLSREQLAQENMGFGCAQEESQILQLLRRKTSIDFAQYKTSTVGRRIQRRMKLAKIEHLDSYASRLADDERELNELYKDLLIGVTQFFRDPDAFEALRKQVIAKLFSQPSEERSIRVWVTACATGEEAYSLAILIDEELRRNQLDVPFKIFATDAHAGSLQRASKGIFSEDAVCELSAERLGRYFTQTSAGFQVNRELRNTIVFAPHNIINDAPFTQIHLVTCRNMLIYLQPTAQKRVLSLFHFALKSEGFLFLGASETPGELKDEFREVDKRWRIYAKRRDVRLPTSSQALVHSRHGKMPYAAMAVPAAKSNRVDQDLVRVYDQLLRKKMACSILVSETGDMLHIFGGAERYLRSRGGRPSNSLMEMIHESLRPSVSAAWHHALTKRETVCYTSTVFTGEGQRESIVITVEPLAVDASEPANVLIEFSQARSLPLAPNSQTDSGCEQGHTDRVESLENELRLSQESLQATIEEMEASNEELQAANEELISSNEELQSTNEELHSVNEELYTVNAEHQRRVEELALANDDMDNLLATTHVGVIFLDEELYIRRFTPEIARVFQLNQQDTGRSMEQFAHVLNHPTLLDDLREVWEDQEARELTVRDRSETPYLMRILPYQSGDKTRGLVVTLIDISSITNAQSEIQLQKLAIETAVNGIVITDPRLEDNPITFTNEGFLNLTGYERDEVLGRNCRFLQGRDTDPQSIRAIRRALDQGQSIRIAVLNYRKDGSRFWNDLQISPVRDHSGKIINFVGVQHDITDQMLAQLALKEANEASQRANEAKDSFLATMSHELRTPMTAILGFADILRGESDDPDYLEKVDTIKRNGSYLLALLNDILDLSKIEAGKMRFERECVDIRRVMSDVESLMSGRARDSSVALRFEYALQLPAVITADEVRIRQILVNLISNALKFTEQGEVVVETAVNHSHASPRLEISVRDTGIGISPEQILRLFRPFSQATQQTTRQFGGTGLGLSISKRLAEGMGGDICVESHLGVGSCFTLTLPISLEQAEVTSEPRESNLQSAKNSSAPRARGYPTINARVLLADDRRDVWLVGKFFLEKCGAQVTIAENGNQAIEAIGAAEQAGNPFSVILMDMQMPVMNGREAVQRLRDAGCTTPIVALTADAMDGEREVCIAMGCDEYFPKPIDGPRLTHLVAKLAARSNA